jgi:hypothetical protein
VPDNEIGSNETVLFLPSYHYPHGVDVQIVDAGQPQHSTASSHKVVSGKKEDIELEAAEQTDFTIDWKMQTLIYTHNPVSDDQASVTITVTKKQKYLARVQHALSFNALETSDDPSKP